MDKIIINGIEYRFRCQYSVNNKLPGSDTPAVHLELFIQKKNGDSWETLNWQDFKKSYLAEKLCDYIRNTINGQRAIYWDSSKTQSFSDEKI